MTKDRTYYRMMDTAELIEEAKCSKDELAIALGERLKKLNQMLWAARYDEAAHRHDYEGQE